MHRFANKMTFLLGAAGVLLAIVATMLVLSSRTSPVGGDLHQLNAAMDELLLQPQATDTGGGKKAVVAAEGNKKAASGGAAGGIVVGGTASPSAGLPSASPASSAGNEPQPAPQGQGLDLNLASAEDLDGLPGIGPSKAQAIIAYRKEHGHFDTIDDLLLVKGIGTKMLETLRPLVFVKK